MNKLQENIHLIQINYDKTFGVEMCIGEVESCIP